MDTHQHPTVTTSDGATGTLTEAPHLSQTGEPTVNVRFADGREVHVPTDSLLQQEDGSFKVMFTVEELMSRQRNPPMNVDEPGGTRLGPDALNNDRDGGTTLHS